MLTPEFIEECIARAAREESKCAPEILAMEGMSGNMTRHLYNQICAYVKDDGDAVAEPTKYLEIGAWKGSSTVSALYKNEHVLATVIDNWSEFGGPKDDFHRNISWFKDQVHVIEDDCFSPGVRDQLASRGPFDIYLYDGYHSEEAHELAITRIWEALADRCLIMIDDYNWEGVRAGTRQGLERAGARIVYERHIENPSGRDGFWNGCGLFLVEKK